MNVTKHFLVISIIVLCVGMLSLSYTQKGIDHSASVKRVGSWYKKEVQRFDALLRDYPRYFLDSSYATRVEKFEELTRQIKKIEGLFIYFHPRLAYETFFLPARFGKQDFGPPLPDNWLFLGPFGIGPDSSLRKFTREDSVFEKKFIERSVTNFRELLKKNPAENDLLNFTEADLFEAMRLQMARISTIGISNGDFVVEQTAMAALEGEYEGWTAMMEMVLEQMPASVNEYKSAVRERLAAGQKMLDAKPAYKSFDRLELLTKYLIPLANDLHYLAKVSGIASKPSLAALHAGGKNIYERGIFNVDFFAPGEESFYTPAKAALGKFLFFDPILSDNNERACASCHKPELAFTDGNIKSMNFERGDLPRNSPTVINAAFQKQQFWDLRATSLEDQLDSVINSQDELHSSFENVINRINSSKEYQQLFYAAFPGSSTTGIERKHVKIAIASYERELTSLNSRFDEYLRGNETILNRAEKNGFNLFVGKAKCGSCHYAPLFSSALPPYFEITDHRSLGVPVKDTMAVYELDGDVGAFKSTNNPFFNFSFKVPTVRNVALTAPYMHNGVYKTLAQVVDFYNHGAGNEFTKQMRPGMKGLPFFMILPDKLNLTKEEKEDLVSFMSALTDTACTSNIPLRLPVIGGAHARLNKRIIGGIY
jgi:cytochrome c peroxidase